MKDIVQSNNEILSRIVRHLILNASYIPDIGLYHGKMGIVLFFAHYGRYIGNTLYDDFASELLDEIYEDIHAETPVNFENGLCGIGWGIEYLLQNEFMEGDSDDVLSDIDQKIMERDIRRITDISFRAGLEGISFYINKRINSLSRKSKKQPFNDIYIGDWKSVTSSISIPNNNVILDIIAHTLPEGEDITSWTLGLENGCAGFGLKKILE
ncbi:MAG: hypothetical protein LBU84_07480 [Prevotella sp.]|jgi:hypothetical protein|nr:hypothetical protein [Prevotella sp.]